MKTATNSNQSIGATGAMERPRYFPRQLITPGEMTLEQNYFRDRLRRHNRLLHGWGVVCGGEVCVPAYTAGQAPAPWMIRVKAGYILGPYGDEIVIDCERTFDLRVSGAGGVCGDSAASDPWCTPVVNKRAGGTVFVAVKYKEVMSRPVRVQPGGCGCGDTQCEYSRMCDGYEIGVLLTCPDAGVTTPVFGDLFTGSDPACPSCPSSPWVVLAEVETDANGAVIRIDNCSCRRLVAGFAGFWWKCETHLPHVDSVTPANGQQGASLELTIAGNNFQPGARVDLGPGVTYPAAAAKITATQIVFTAAIADDAAIGDRNVTIMNPDCSTASFSGKFHVDAKVK